MTTSSITLSHPWTAGVIFGMTFLAISFRQIRWLPIGRPTFTLLGAVLMVGLGVMTPEQAYQQVNWDTIGLLLGMMIIAEHLRDAGLFDRISLWMEKRGSPTVFLFNVTWVSALASAFLVNDTICVVMTPLLLGICENRRLNPFPFLMALATSANIGSALTLTGNPQNMIIGVLSGMDYAWFIQKMFLPVGLSLSLNFILLYWFYRPFLKATTGIPKSISSASICGESAYRRGFRRSVLGLFLACAGFFTGFSMAFSALAGATLVMVTHRKDPKDVLARVDWPLLLFFAALFVVIGGLRVSGLAEMGTRWALQSVSGTVIHQGWIFSGVTLAGSNLFSNVPFVLLAGQSIPALPLPKLFWCLLAYVSTVAGNLTLFGSVANLIVAESARGRCEIGFAAYARFGIPSTILCTSIGTAILIALHTMVP